MGNLYKSAPIEIEVVFFFDRMKGWKKLILNVQVVNFYFLVSLTGDLQDIVEF